MRLVLVPLKNTRDQIVCNIHSSCYVQVRLAFEQQYSTKNAHNEKGLQIVSPMWCNCLDVFQTGYTLLNELDWMDARWIVAPIA